ncbi:hypothetical protein [Paraburkholderia sp. BL25I1N1]|uniref:hypothetical protein n=1 Tax=Paraburkholderia sp. BL25I1N1 TaxID=1938804 RepID=UPI000D06BACC|nr:hypothetical protein [Paraburkholderia sp. BL25I1N1]PRY03784.1 hypothetical protein B0G73_114105 [Paraburkholderia sp. BL25I1N1]
MSDQTVEELLDLTESGGAGFEKSDVKNFDIEKEKINLARWVLTGLATLFLIACLFYVAKSDYVSNAAAKEVFDFVREAFPPIVTLVLGAYFTRKSD